MRLSSYLAVLKLYFVAIFIFELNNCKAQV